MGIERAGVAGGEGGRGGTGGGREVAGVAGVDAGAGAGGAQRAGRGRHLTSRVPLRAAEVEARFAKAKKGQVAGLLVLLGRRGDGAEDWGGMRNGQWATVNCQWEDELLMGDCYLLMLLFTPSSCHLLPSSSCQQSNTNQQWPLRSARSSRTRSRISAGSRSPGMRRWHGRQPCAPGSW